MMNEALVKRMKLEYQLLYKASLSSQLEDRYIRERTQEAVRNVRAQLKTNGRDQLLVKANNFPNNGAWAVAKMRELARALYQDKSPDHVDLGEWVSVEIELFFDGKEKETNFVAWARTNKYAKMITLKHDGSLHPDECDCSRPYDDETDEHGHEDDCSFQEGVYGKEIVITFKYGNWEFVNAVCKKLNSLGCFVNKTCGLHVHFDMRHMENPRKVSAIGQRIARSVPMLKKMLPKSRQDNRFCSETINSISESRGGSEARYAFVNLLAYGRHKTIEVRGHSGTTDALKIVNWIRLVRTIMSTPNGSDIESVDLFLKKMKFDADLQAYYLDRVAKFSGSQPRGIRDDVAVDNHAAEAGQVELNFEIAAVPSYTIRAYVEGVRAEAAEVAPDLAQAMINASAAIVANQGESAQSETQADVA